MRKLTKAQREALFKMAATPEALLQKPYFFGCDGKIVAEASIIERLTRAGFVEIDAVGESRFARITPTGRAALKEPDNAS